MSTDREEEHTDFEIATLAPLALIATDLNVTYFLDSPYITSLES